MEQLKMFEMREACFGDLETLQQILANDAGYSMRVNGHRAEDNAAQEMMAALPLGRLRNDKFVFLLEYGGKAIGCADVIRGYPNQNVAWIGLLLISELYQRKNFGALAFDKIESKILCWNEINRIQLSVVMTNSIILPFWLGLGFSQIGVPKYYRVGPVNSELIILERKIERLQPN